MEKNDRVLVTGHEGMTGSAILHRLQKQGYTNTITRTSTELDLTDQQGVLDFFMSERPEYVFLSSVKAGGILANSQYPAEFIYTTLQGQTNVIHSAWKVGVKKLLFLASSCIYPKECPQPMKEEYLLSGKLEPTSEPYALAKIAGVKMCQSYSRQYGVNFICAVPADTYGPNDDFDPETGHVLPALMSKMHRAKTANEPRVVLFGTGTPRRDCLHVDDLADACLFLMQHYHEAGMVNVGSGGDLSIKELARLISDVVAFEGEVAFDALRPDGMPRKLLDTGRMTGLGWSPRISPEEGIRQTYKWYQNQAAQRVQERIKR